MNWNRLESTFEEEKFLVKTLVKQIIESQKAHKNRGNNNTVTKEKEGGSWVQL